MSVALAFESSTDGDAVVLQVSSGANCVSSDFNQLLEFLQFTGKHVFRFAFELDEFIAPVLRKLPLSGLQELADTKETVAGRFRIYYIPGRLFQVGPVGQPFGTRYYGIKRFLNIMGILPTPPLEQVRETGQDILDTVEAIGLGEPKRLTTAGAMFTATDIGSKLMQSIPTTSDYPPGLLEDIVEMSVLADNKYWVMAYQVGCWMLGLFDYDLTACFASIAASLVDIRDMEFWRSDSVGKREQGAYYGLVRGRFHLDMDAEYSHASPIVVEQDNDLVGQAYGWIPEDVYTLDEIRVVERYSLGEFIQTGQGVFAKIMNGVHPRYPFREAMEWLYTKRSWSEMASTICKTAANAVVGKLIERERGDGSVPEYRNQFYHALITAQTRCAITKFLVENEVKESELVTVQTDGVRLTRDIPLRNSRMGSWRSNGEYPCIIVSGHKVYTGDKRPYKITFDDIVEMVCEHPYIERYSKKGWHRTTIQEASEAGDISKIGEMVNLPTYFDLIGLDREQTRVFPRVPKNGLELLSGQFGSEPIILA